MLTEEEQKFVAYWQVQRTKKRRIGFNLGFPLGVLIVAGIFINVVSGWYSRANAALSSDFSTILVILLAGVGIVIFLTFFSAQYQKEQNEQRYKELLAKKERTENETKSDNGEKM